MEGKVPVGIMIFAVSFSLAAISVVEGEGEFLSCLTSQSPGTPLSDIVYSPNAASYSSVLQLSLQNLRFNTSQALKPTFIVTPRNISHIQAAVVCSKSFGLQIRTRSGGHDYEGRSYTSSRVPFVLIDLVNLAEVTIDVKSQTAVVQSGATVGKLYYQITKASGTLAFPAGICPSLGIGGHFSGGGQSPLGRKYGLSADNVLDATLVDVNGKVLDRKSMGEDHFWAIRGGGGASFGVIVSWKIKLVPVPPKVSVFNVVKTLEQNATHLVYRWQDIAHKLDKDLFISIITRAGQDSQGKFTIQAVFKGVYLGTTDKLIPLMKKSFPEFGLETKDCTEMTWLQSILDGQPVDVLLDRTLYKKFSFKAKSDYIYSPIPEKKIAAIWDSFKGADGSIMMWIPYGGRYNEIPETEIPFPHREGTIYLILYYTQWQGENATTKHLDWIENLYNSMTPLVSKERNAFLNYRDLDLGKKEDGNPTYSEAQAWGLKYFKNNFERLARVKAKVDPQNFFKNEQGIPPLSS